MHREKVLIIGMGISGRSAAEFLLHQGAVIVGIDRDPQLLDDHPEIQTLKKAGVTIFSEGDCPPVSQFTLIVLSPGVPFTHPLIQTAEKGNIPICGEIELGCRVAKNPILGITGTNGKTTVTLLVTHVLSNSGIQSKALGNVGIPFTKELLTLDSECTIVLELSSYQLETLHHPCLMSGAILNITPDHLDRYKTMDAYAKAKWEIGRALKQGGYLYVEEKTWLEYGHLSTGQQLRLYGYTPPCFIYTDLNYIYRQGKKAFELPSSLKAKKSHDLENFMAAYALCADQGVSGEMFLQGYRSFKKPAHRIEYVKEFQGVHYYDDSKGTNIDAVIRAVETLEGPIVLIAGGVDKGSSYTPWIKGFANKIKLICAIGQSAGKISAQLGDQLPVKIFSSLEEAVRHAAQSAKRGDIVLLSPGCSSFDMFKDYAHRGQEFQRIVHELTNI